jgi:hypothetical protein
MPGGDSERWREVAAAEPFVDSQMSRKLRQISMDNKLRHLPWLYGQDTSPRGLEDSVDDSVEAVDEAVVARLRHAIGVEEEDDEKQLNAVLRMLGAAIPDSKQLPLKGRPGA